MKTKRRALKDSVNYHTGRFGNLSVTPVMAKGVSYRKVLYDLFNRPKDTTPSAKLPFVKTDLNALRSEEPVIVWFGHSSYLIHCRGINILVDPVFSGYASPFPGMVKAFDGANEYSAEDMPVIDIMVITHNHYDHLDKRTIARLKGKTKSFYVPLGVADDIAGCGGDDVKITEMDWWETEIPAPGITLTATPARHFSGRGVKRGGSLWSSFALQLFGYSIFIGGDSGYDKHFKEIGTKHGPFDLAILECGQYNTSWPFIHMMPEETAQAAVDLGAKVLMPVHWAKFVLANHPWNEPVKRVSVKSEALNLALTTPKIGEPVIINRHYPKEIWW